MTIDLEAAALAYKRVRNRTRKPHAYDVSATGIHILSHQIFGSASAGDLDAAVRDAELLGKAPPPEGSEYDGTELGRMLDQISKGRIALGLDGGEIGWTYDSDRDGPNEGTFRGEPMPPMNLGARVLHFKDPGDWYHFDLPIGPGPCHEFELTIDVEGAIENPSAISQLAYCVYGSRNGGSGFHSDVVFYAFVSGGKVTFRNWLGTPQKSTNPKETSPWPGAGLLHYAADYRDGHGMLYEKEIDLLDVAGNAISPPYGTLWLALGPSPTDPREKPPIGLVFSKTRVVAR